MNKTKKILMILGAPLMGLAYAMFLPFIGIAMLLYLLIKKMFELISEALQKTALMTWAHSGAYPSTRQKKMKDKASST